MRSTLLVLLASAAIVSAGGCAQNTIDELVAETLCGSAKAITQCLGSADLNRLDEIERCYSSNGCTVGEATVEAVWFAKDCQTTEVEISRGDLKRRAGSTESTTAESTTAKTTAKTTSAKTSAKSTSAPSSTSATTTADSTTASDSSTSSTTSAATTASSTTSSSASSSASSTGTSSTSSSSSGTALVCSVTSTISTSVCYTTSGTSSCTATTTETASCANGLICFSASASATASCMVRDVPLTTSGWVVTGVFSFGLAATIIIIIIKVMRDKKIAKQHEYAQAMAAADRKGGDIEAQGFSAANRSQAAIPLITPGGARSEQTTYRGQQQPTTDYFGQTGAGGNSVTPPAGRGAPQLHQGLGALGQERRY